MKRCDRCKADVTETFESWIHPSWSAPAEPRELCGACYVRVEERDPNTGERLTRDCDPQSI